MDLMVNPVITDFQQDVNGDIKMLKLGVKKEDAYANIIGQAGSAKLDNNKTATINVSTYTEPVEVLPTSGKDGMKKATITLSNIPSGVSTLYAWSVGSSVIYTITETPQSGSTVLEGTETSINTGSVSDVTEEGIVYNTFTYERYAESDISLT